jgi:hypothetical protein
LGAALVAAKGLVCVCVFGCTPFLQFRVYADQHCMLQWFHFGIFLAILLFVQPPLRFLENW